MPDICGEITISTSTVVERILVSSVVTNIVGLLQVGFSARRSVLSEDAAGEMRVLFVASRGL